MVWTPGQPLQDGKYIIDRVLGVGGFGITYLAIQNSRRYDQRSVVIKTLKDEIRHDPKFANYQTKLQQDFLNEALKLAKCLHPHIVEVQEIIREDNLDCIVMEFVQGESLADRLSRQGVLPETEALRYVQQAGDALTVVHSRGLLHRDIKPQNIMIRSGTAAAVLIDFGLAREFMQDLIQTHSLALTHGFAPPEQYDRRARRGAYSDVYALAATLYCSLTKHIPHPAYMRISGTVLESPQQLNPGISDRVNQAILKGLELRAENRPQSMPDWLDLLKKPIARPVAPVRNLPQQPELPYSIPQKPSIAEQNRTSIAQPVAPLQNIPRQSANSTPQRPLSAAQNRTLVTRRRSRTISWIGLLLVLASYAVIGASLTAFSTPLWVMAMAMAGVVAGAMAGAMAGAWAGAEIWVWIGALGGTSAGVVAWAESEFWDGVWAWVGAWAGTRVWAFMSAWLGITVGLGALAMALAGTGYRLLDSFSRSHTFLILAGTSLAGLGLGWLIVTVLRSSGFVFPTFGML